MIFYVYVEYHLFKMSEFHLIIEKTSVYQTGIVKPYNGDNVENCPICISNDEFTYKSWVELKCGHHFHRHCIDLWLEEHQTCPICVQNVNFKIRSYNTYNTYNTLSLSEVFRNCVCCIFLIVLVIVVIFLIKFSI